VFQWHRPHSTKLTVVEWVVLACSLAECVIVTSVSSNSGFFLEGGGFAVAGTDIVILIQLCIYSTNNRVFMYETTEVHSTRFDGCDQLN
jgi:hypothetical protein